MVKRCATCYYMVPSKQDKTYGQCHRFPPKVVLTSDNRVSSGWPSVPIKGWCGEWMEGVLPVNDPPMSKFDTYLQRQSVKPKKKAKTR